LPSSLSVWSEELFTLFAVSSYRETQTQSMKYSEKKMILKVKEKFTNESERHQE